MSVPDHTIDVRQLLLTEAALLSYAGWYATPLLATAEALYAQARQTTQQALAAGNQPLAPRLAELIAGFWLGRNVALEHLSLIATQPPEAQALVELIYGQLLVSRKRVGALEHLDRGFMLAIPRLAPADYFTLLRRHDLLRVLPLSVAGSAPQTLGDLLTEARVIRRLQPAGRHAAVHPHDDTLG